MTRVGLQAEESIRLSRQTARDLEDFKKVILGSKPPPATNMHTRVTENEQTIDAVHGVVLGLDGRTARLEKELAAQSKKMGIDKAWWQFLSSHEGRKMLLHIAVALAAFWTAIHQAVR
jgi:hypothetical protein